MEARVDAELPCLPLERVALRAGPVDLQPNRAPREGRRLEQEVDALPHLEVGHGAGDQRPPVVVRFRRFARLDAEWDHVHEAGGEAVLEHEVRHRTRGRHDVAEARE